MNRHKCASTGPRMMVVLSLSVVIQVGAAGQHRDGDREAVDLRGVAHAGARREASAVVWLEAREHVAARAKAPVVLTQRNLAFLPRILAIPAGTTVQFPNEDRVFHNVFSFHESDRFDLGTYPVGAQKQVVFSKVGVSRLLCNIHPNMAGYVVTVDSPYVAASNPDGSFTIAGVPPGTYTYHAWRPSGPELTGTWTVASDPTSNGVLEVVWR